MACGSEVPAPVLSDDGRPTFREVEDEDAALTLAKEAWAHGDHHRAVGHILTLGVQPRSFSIAAGNGWVGLVHHVPVYALFDGPSMVSLEIPVARLPATRRVPAMRAALALTEDAGTCAHLCLRSDLLILRFTDHVDSLTVTVLRRTARDMALAALRLADRFAAQWNAPSALPDQGVASPPDRLGRPLGLTSIAAPLDRVERMALSDRPSALPSTRPSSLTPPAGFHRPITLRISIPPDVGPEADDDDIPAILAPMFAGDAGAAAFAAAPPAVPPPAPTPVASPPGVSRTPVSPSIPPPQEASHARTIPPLGDPFRAPATPTFPATPPPAPRNPLSSTGTFRAASSPGGLGEEAPASRRGVRVSSQMTDLTTPEGKLCELLRHALSLATQLSYDEKPTLMLLLARAAVFRAAFEHAESVPNAVAHLYRATRSLTREIWTSKQDTFSPHGAGRPTTPTSPGPARGSVLPIPVAEPAFATMEQLVAARGVVSKERTLQIDPWTSAAQAKEQLAKYLGEIELAPQDPGLRHFLALGALSELLCRTRLPAPTDQRLRDIVAFSQRDGARPQALELMMTALRKIVSG